jgi:hypothetical protein
VAQRQPPPPPWMLGLQLLYVVALVGLAVLYAHSGRLGSLIPDPAGPVPLAIPWWGALGAVTISMTGIFRNRLRWDPSFTCWHIARPIVGAIAGSVGYLIFVTVIRSAGTSVAAGPPPSGGVFDLVAFLIGYREAVFRELLQHATDLLLKPSDKSKGASSADQDPSESERGSGEDQSG